MINVKISSFFAGALVLGISSTAIAQNDNNAHVRIDLASAQSMLAEQMTQSACMLHVGLQPDVYNVKLEQARQSFEANLAGLTQGDSKIGLTRESDTSLIAEHDEVRTVWKNYEVIMFGLLEDDTLLLSKLDASGREMLEQTLDAAARTTRVHSGDETGLTTAEALALNIAGRQRMFSQMMLKEMCLLASGTEPDLNRARYNETVKLFTASLNGLRHGQPDVGLIAPPTNEIETQLAEVDMMWQPMRAFMEDFAQEEEPDLIYLEVIAGHMDTLKKALEEVFVSYETSMIRDVPLEQASDN